jgi:hypothetical protein
MLGLLICLCSLEGNCYNSDGGFEVQREYGKVGGKRTDWNKLELGWRLIPLFSLWTPSTRLQVDYNLNSPPIH